MTTVLTPRGTRLGAGFTPAERFDGDHRHPGRRTDGTQSAASWMTDLTDTRKVILLCGWCRAKFNPRRHGYRTFFVPDPTGATSGYVSNGPCDACKQPTAATPGGGTSFVTEETYHLTCVDPAEVRRASRARARAAAPSLWNRMATWATRRAPEATGRSLT